MMNKLNKHPQELIWSINKSSSDWNNWGGAGGGVAVFWLVQCSCEPEGEERAGKASVETNGKNSCEKHSCGQQIGN